MATSALAGAARHSRRLRLSPSTFNNASSTPKPAQEFVNSPSAATLAQLRDHRWAPITAVLAEKERAQHSRSVNLALGVVGGVGLALLGLKTLGQNAVLCDGAELQTAAPEALQESPVVASKAYSLLAGWSSFQLF